MNKKIILSLLIVLIISLYSIASAYNIYEINQKLASCTPTLNLRASASTSYRIFGITDSVCNFKIINNNAQNKSELMCRIPYTEMHKMTSARSIPYLKKQYCKIHFKKFI